MVFSIIFLEDKHNILLHLSIFYEYQQFFFQHYLFLDTNETSHVTTHATHSDLWPTLARSTSFFLVMLFNKMDKLFINWPNILKLIIILHRYHICTYNCKKNCWFKKWNFKILFLEIYRSQTDYNHWIYNLFN